MAPQHLQYSSIIVWIYCQDAESATPTLLLPLEALIWECAAVTWKCMKMFNNTVSHGCSWALVVSGAGKHFTSSFIKLQKVQE